MIFNYHLQVVEAAAAAASITNKQAYDFLNAVNSELIARGKENTGNQIVMSHFAEAAQKLI